ncbi:DUF2726 domain-containing protein [Sphingomonas glaciei]|uniref:DUF2726 domain-containing protein n=1 Tax=Sphingomonas glaciei TaxID=2938948 RepID=A0ABY5MWQ9_9SPHN|nr:DUF2726 domain-containing protein [Sphingomonas glaciei]UUR08246.1 DUF2726 domain-containing protein [Sphingomonas glaciei]
MSNPYMDILATGAGQAVPHLVPLAVFVFVSVTAFAALSRMFGTNTRRGRGKWRQKGEWNQRPRKGAPGWRGPGAYAVGSAEPAPPIRANVNDAAEQLRIVMASEFRPKRLLNKGEEKVLAALEPIVAELEPGWRVWTQVSLGEVLDGGTVEAFNTINAKRVDFLLVDADQRPRVAIEYQGQGHHQGAAAARDAVKKEALRRAGVGYGEVFAGDGPAELAQVVARVMAGAGVERTFGVRQSV